MTPETEPTPTHLKPQDPVPLTHYVQWALPRDAKEELHNEIVMPHFPLIE